MSKYLLYHPKPKAWDSLVIRYTKCRKRQKQGGRHTESCTIFIVPGLLQIGLAHSAQVSLPVEPASV